MVFKLFLVAAIWAATVQAARVQFWTTRDGCAGPSSEDYQNVRCNSCVDPPLDWFAAEVSEIGNTRWTCHNQNDCTPGSQVGQFYGPTCVNAGHTAIRSVWVAC